MKFKRRSVIGVAVSTALASRTAWAQQAWPTRPVRWIVPWAPGGAADVVARTLADKLSQRWGQPVNIENKPGGNTVIGAMEGKHAAPDGYTLFQPISSTLTVNPFTYSRLPYDPVRDFTPIGIIAGVPLVILASDKLQARTLTEVIAQAKKSPELITIGSAVGSQLQVEQWMRDWGVKLRYVPYKSGADITKAILGNEVDLGVDGIPNNQPHIKAGKMRGLAVNSASRIASMTEVPTLDEQRIPHSEPSVWHGLVAPAGLPAELQRRIAGDVEAVLAMTEVRDKLTGLGLEPVWIPAAEFAARVRTESARVAPLVKELGIKMD